MCTLVILKTLEIKTLRVLETLGALGVLVILEYLRAYGVLRAQ